MPTASETSIERASLLSRRFWGAHVLLVLALLGCAAGSDWQFHVWAATRHAAEAVLTTKPPVPLASVLHAGEAYPGSAIGRPVTLTGTWLPESTFYVANQPSPQDSQRTGYWVATLVRLGTTAVPVLRGWTASASAPPVSGPVSMRGWVEPSDEGDAVQTATHPPTYGSLSIAALTQAASLPLLPGYVAVRAGAPGTEGVVATGPTVTAGAGGATGLLNFLYGIQWILFAVLSGYLWWRWCRDWSYQRAEDDAASGATDAEE